MTGQQDQPEPAERGRYAVYMQPDGGIVIARAADICQTCQDCGCGVQAEPLTIPAALASMARMAAEGKMKLPSVKQLKAMAGARGPAASGRR